LDEKLTEIKICDPAIGSGAFPVGLLHELVNAQLVLKQYLSEKYLNKKLRKLEVTQQEIKEQPEKYNYRVKRHTIQESIYGVDIDASAIDIARLRLWLSLVVDEEDLDNIEALPNLDYKIVCGNSLIGFPENWKSPAFSKLEELKNEFFTETDSNKKKEIKKEIDQQLKERLEGSEKVFGYKVDFDFKLFFSEVWHEKSGFDVVIGNPPYDVYEGTRKEEIPTIKNIPLYDKAKTGKFNAYKLFLAKASSITKSNGNTTLIFQNSFLADNSAKKLREFYLNEQTILKIDSFPERDDVQKRVFKSAKMSVCIMSVRNQRQSQYDFLFKVWHERQMENSYEITFKNNEILNFDIKTFAIPSISVPELPVLKKLSTLDRFGDYSNCFQGEVNLSTCKEIITEHPSSNTKPLLKGAGIQRWFFPLKMSQGKEEYLFHKEFLKNNNGPRAKHHKDSRIVMQGITGVDEKIRLKSNILVPGVFCGHSVNYLIFNNPVQNEEIRFYLSLLNSSCLNWFFKKFSTNSNVNSYEVNNLPVVKYKSGYHSISILIEYLLFCYNPQKINSKIISLYFDNIADSIAFELYFPTEIKSAGKEILKHLGDLKPISDSMSDEEKLAIIQSEFERLYDPNHPVRNNIETLDSVEEVRIIKEALK
jgi:Alw26I/Eco31I/Esp3I family type II restriction m6 adenine DNA methyltransferase